MNVIVATIDLTEFILSMLDESHPEYNIIKDKLDKLKENYNKNFMPVIQSGTKSS